MSLKIVCQLPPSLPAGVSPSPPLFCSPRALFWDIFMPAPLQRGFSKVFTSHAQHSVNLEPVVFWYSLEFWWKRGRVPVLPGLLFSGCTRPASLCLPLSQSPRTAIRRFGRQRCWHGRVNLWKSRQQRAATADVGCFWPLWADVTGQSPPCRSFYLANCDIIISDSVPLLIHQGDLAAFISTNISQICFCRHSRVCRR